MRYKVRRVEGEPVPMNVLAEMERRPAEPWKVRDRMLYEMGWCSKGIPWAEWKAAALNRLFHTQGTTGKTGRITAASVRHGEREGGRQWTGYQKTFGGSANESAPSIARRASWLRASMRRPQIQRWFVM
jgi:hypothetical protein